MTSDICFAVTICAASIFCEHHKPTDIERSETVELFLGLEGVYALVTLSHPALVRDAIYKLWDAKLHGRKITIELDSEPKVTTINEVPEKVPPPILMALPAHLHHRSRPETMVGKAGDYKHSPEQLAIAENRRMYIRNLPYGTTEEILQDLLKDLSVYTILFSYLPLSYTDS